MAMREQRWHLRRISAEHQRRYQNLTDLGTLTHAWKGETRPAPRLEDLLDDTSPDDLINRLEKEIWIDQAIALSEILLGNKDAKDTKPTLEGLSRTHGRLCAAKRWDDFDKNRNKHITHDLRKVLAAFHYSPLSGFPKREGFLIRRVTITEVRIELHLCPHQSPYSEVRQVADELCKLHGYWVSGYISHFNSRILSHRYKHHRCEEHWIIPPDPPIL